MRFIYAGTFLFLCFMVVTCLNIIFFVRRKKKLSLVRKLIVVFNVIVLIIVVSLVFYGTTIEPGRLETNQIELFSEKIHANHEIKIIQISDLHSPSSRQLWNRIIKIIAQEKPDLVVFTGDFSHTENGRLNGEKFFSQISKIAPVYAIRGNTDSTEKIDYFGPQITELHGKILELTFNNTRINLTGYSVPGDWKHVYSSLKNRNKNLFTIFLSHSPDEFHDIANWGSDLYLAGHTHGGQISLPFYGAIWTASRFGKQFEKGKYFFNDTMMYINKGLGFSDGHPPVRIGAVPELTIIILKNPDKLSAQ